MSVRTVFRAVIGDSDRKAALERIARVLNEKSVGPFSDEASTRRALEGAQAARRSVVPEVTSIARWIRESYGAPVRRPPDGISAGFGDDKLEAWVYFFAWLVTISKATADFWDAELKIAMGETWR